MDANPGPALAPGDPRHRDVYWPSLVVEEPQERCRTSVTERRSVAAGKHSGQPSPLLGQASMPDGVDAAMDAVQLPALHSTRDAAVADPGFAKLSSIDHPVLPRRQGRNLEGRLGAFRPHTGHKAPSPSVSPRLLQL